ncbi:MAG: hypothetical protein ABI401_04095 [Candidatus Dormibacter sp.]
MAARSRRLLTRIALAALLVAVGLPGATIAAEAAASPISLTAKLGYQGVYKLQEWMPVTIEVKNSGPDFTGSLEIEAAFTGQPGLASPAIYSTTLSLAAGAAKHLRSYAIVSPAGGVTLTVRVLQGGRLMASQAASSGTQVPTLIGVLSDDPSALDDLAAVHPAGISAHVVHLSPEDLAQSAITLRAFDLLVIDDYATDTLTSGQRTALADFVRNGGALLIGTGASWRKTLAGIPAELVTARPTGTATIATSQALGGPATLEIAAGIAGSQAGTWLAEASHPLLIETPVGSGLVTLATFDWNQPAVGAAVGTKGLLRQLLVRDLFASAAQQNFPIGVGGGGFSSLYGGAGTSISERSNALSSVLGDVPALDLPSLQLTGLLVLLYVLLVGPINYLVLGAMHRRELSWVTIPLIAVIVAGGAYGIGVGTKGRSVQSNQVAILHLASGGGHAYQETFTGIMAPTRGDYQVSAAGESLFISPLSANGNFGGSSGSTRIDTASNVVTLQGLTAFSLRGFATESMTPAPQLVGHLQLVNGLLTGRVENHSSIAFDDAVVLAGDSYQKLGALTPGGAVSIKLAVKPANPFGGQPLYTRIYPNASFGPPPNNPSAADRQGQARTQILSLLQPGLGFKGPASMAVQPLVVAWSERPIQEVTVNGAHPRATAETAVALSLPIDQLGAGSLPAGAVTGRLVDITGETQVNGPPGVFTLQNGSATYEFTPTLETGRHLTAASVTVSNPFGAKVMPPAANGTPGTASPQADVWDWSRGAWTSITYQDNGITAIPDAAINPVSNAVRLRVTGANASITSGGASLTGTVQ